MRDLKRTLKTLFTTGFFHIFGSSVINKIIAFLSSVVLVRILSKPEYGVFTYAWNIYSIILLFNGMGMDSGTLQLSSERSGDTDFGEKVTNFGARFGAVFDLLLLVTILCIALFAPLKIDGSREILKLLCLLPTVSFLFQMTVVSLRAQKRNREYARLTVLNTGLIFVVSAGCAFVLRERGLVAGYYAAYIISVMVAMGAYHVKLFSKGRTLEKSDRDALLKISFISMLNSGLSQLMYLLDVFVLGLIDAQETVLASYKVATMIPTALSFIPIALITYLYPFFAEHKDDGAWCLRKYREILLGIGAVNFGISAILFLGAPIIIRILFGAEYLDAVPVFRVLSVSYFFSGTFRILSGNLLVTQRKLKFNLLVAVISSLANILADYYFIQLWGSIGAAFATLLVVWISSVLSTAYLIYTFRHARDP